MKDEIVAGMRNALARGQSLEQAARSFINAGYNPQEVKAATQTLSSGVSQFIRQGAAPGSPEAPSPGQKDNNSATPLPTSPGVKKKGDGKLFLIIFLVFILIAILVGGGLLAYYYLLK